MTAYRRRRPGWATGATEHESTGSGYCHGNALAVQLRRRRTASWRCEPLDSGHRDPWTPWRPEHPSENQVDGYRSAALHLLALQLDPHPLLPELRALWRRDGHDRDLARTIADRWGVTT